MAVSLTPPDARRIFLKELKRRIIKARSAQTVGWLEQHLENATDSVLAQIDDKLNTLNTFLLRKNSILIDAQQQQETTVVYALTGNEESIKNMIDGDAGAATLRSAKMAGKANAIAAPLT
ncbi:uncharacterized protein LOC132798007 [Drosophila nasuta]|uniref:uncharacterized protein LOC132798007 n=1 Tax=Drosophila nasuta TaxID=42062 RepID=UPI00295E4592|nr:uncharacterized protein LOC132798007 [Drosophila nasuta]